MPKLPMFIRSGDVLRQLAEHEDRIDKLEKVRASDATLHSLEALVNAVEKVEAAISKNTLDAATLSKYAKLLDANTAGIVEAQRDDDTKPKV